MALQASGQISLNDLHVEAGGSSGTECSFNDSDIRDLIDKSSGAQSAINEFYGASAVSAPVWSTSNSGTFDLGNPTHTEVKTSGSSFTLSYNGAVAIIAIGGGGGGSGTTGGASTTMAGATGAGVAIKGIVGTTSMSFSMSIGGGGAGAENASGSNGGDTTVSGNGISLTGGGGKRGTHTSTSQAGGSASGGDANYTGGTSTIVSSRAGAGGAPAGGNSTTSTSGTYGGILGGTSPYENGVLGSYLGTGGQGDIANQWGQGLGSHGSNYGAGGGSGSASHSGNASTGSGRFGKGGNGSQVAVVVMYWT